MKLSIIMPIYNAEKLLLKSIDSVIDQNIDDFELICINDGSTDNSLNVLNNYASKYDFIKIISQENKGPSKTRNKGIEIASGEYIAFLDSDDIFIDENALNKMYDLAIKYDADVVSSNMQFVEQDYSIKENPHYGLGDYIQFDEYSCIDSKDYGIPFAFYKNIFKREFLIKNEIVFPDLSVGEDPVFMAKVLTNTSKIVTAPLVLYGYNYSNGGGVNNKINTYRKKKEYIKHFKYVFDILDENSFHKTSKLYERQLFGFLNWNDNIMDNNLFEIYNEFFKLYDNNFCHENLDYIVFNINASSYLLNNSEDNNIFEKIKHEFNKFDVYENLNNLDLIDKYFLVLFSSSLNDYKTSYAKLYFEDKKFIIKLTEFIINKFKLYFDNCSNRLTNIIDSYYFRYLDDDFKEMKYIRNPDKPRVSIISVVQNFGNHLWEYYNNILNQTLDDFELICVYDSNKRKPLKILNDIAEYDSRVKVYKMDKKYNSPWDLALENIRGKFVLFHNPNYNYSVNALFDFYLDAVDNKSDLVLFKFNEEMDYSNNLYVINSKQYDQINKEDYLFNSIPTPWFKFYRKEFLDKNNFNFNLNNPLNYRLSHIQSIIKAENISYIPEFYHFFDYDLKNKYQYEAYDLIEHFDELSDFFKNEECIDKFSEEFNRYILNQVYLSLFYFKSNQDFIILKEKILKLSFRNELSFKLFKMYYCINNSYSLKEFLYVDENFRECNTINEFKLKRKILKLTSKKKNISRKNKLIKKQTRQLSKLNNDIKSSSSWKITKPLRFFKINK